MNLAYTLLYLVGKALQSVFLGPLTQLETQNVYDHLVHYALFKVLVIGTVLEPQLLHSDHTTGLLRGELLAWTAWFSCLGFGKTFALLCRDRFRHVRRLARRGRLARLTLARSSRPFPFPSAGASTSGSWAASCSSLPAPPAACSSAPGSRGPG